MHTANLRAVGGSVMLAIPKAILEALGLRQNAEVGLSIDEGRIIIAPHPGPHYSLSELLAQCDMKVPASDEDRQWTQGGPVGDEAL